MEIETLMAEVTRIAEMRDITERAKAIGELVKVFDSAHRLAIAERAAVVRLLRDPEGPAGGLSHAEVGRLLGVATTTAQQIAEGKQTGRRRRKPEPDTAEEL